MSQNKKSYLDLLRYRIVDSPLPDLRRYSGGQETLLTRHSIRNLPPPLLLLLGHAVHVHGGGTLDLTRILDCSPSIRRQMPSHARLVQK